MMIILCKIVVRLLRFIDQLFGTENGRLNIFIVLTAGSKVKNISSYCPRLTRAPEFLILPSLNRVYFPLLVGLNINQWFFGFELFHANRSLWHFFDRPGSNFSLIYKIDAKTAFFLDCRPLHRVLLLIQRGYCVAAWEIRRRELFSVLLKLIEIIIGLPERILPSPPSGSYEVNVLRERFRGAFKEHWLAGLRLFKQRSLKVCKVLGRRLVWVSLVVVAPSPSYLWSFVHNWSQNTSLKFVWCKL